MTDRKNNGAVNCRISGRPHSSTIKQQKTLFVVTKHHNLQMYFIILKKKLAKVLKSGTCRYTLVDNIKIAPLVNRRCACRWFCLSNGKFCISFCELLSLLTFSAFSSFTCTCVGVYGEILTN